MHSHKTKIGFGILLAALVFFAETPARSADTTNSPASDPRVAELETELTNAVKEVEAIVNQVVPAYKRARGMEVSKYEGGWFHPGAQNPNYNADVRTTQEKPYDDKPYVTSDLNPGLVWMGNQLEFNANLKFFYTNRTFPKKKLTDAEMQRINALYKTIGRCDHELKAILHPEDFEPHSGAAAGEEAAPAAQPRLLDRKKGLLLLACAAAVLLLSFAVRKLRSR